MRLTSPIQGAHFGNLGVRIRGIVYYRLSPFEQRAFAGAFSSFPKIARRLTGNLPYIVPPFAVAYLVYTSTMNKFHQMCRKNPADYVDDK